MHKKNNPAFSSQSVRLRQRHSLIECESTAAYGEVE